MLMQICPDIFSTAAGLSNAILKLLTTEHSTSSGVQAALQRLAEIVECLPLDQSAYCYFHNRVISTSELLATDEIAAARYQLREMSRKLCRFAESFDDCPLQPEGGRRKLTKNGKSPEGCSIRNVL